MTTTPLIGTKLGTVKAGPLEGWSKVAIGDGGRYITTKSGVCFGRQHDPSIPTDLAWVAVNAYLIAKARGDQLEITETTNAPDQPRLPFNHLATKPTYHESDPFSK